MHKYDKHNMLLDSEQRPVKLLFLLLSADLVFIFLHVGYMNGLLWNPLFSVGQERGYADVYQYIKEYWIVLLLLILVIRTKHVIYIAWSILFMYLLLDDSLEIHERLGFYLASYFEFQPGFNLRAQDFGELSVSVFMGTILFLFVGVAYLFSDAAQKKISRHLFILVLILAFFGVVIDMLGFAIPWGYSIWGTIEDGGEILIMSIIVWYVFYLKSEYVI